MTAAPTGYGDLTTAIDSYATTGMTWKKVASAGAEDPGFFTNTSGNHAVQTIALRKFVASSQVNDYSLSNLGQVLSGGVSGSATSTGSFGMVKAGGSVVTADDTSWNDGTATTISGSSTSTGSFGTMRLDYDNLPTSDPSVKGAVWRDGTDLKISAG